MIVGRKYDDSIYAVQGPSIDYELEMIKNQPEALFELNSMDVYAKGVVLVVIDGDKKDQPKPTNPGPGPGSPQGGDLIVG